jgi:serine/threonine protein phosphatase 1
VSGRVFAIGDIHGCAAELEALLAGLPLAPGDTLACVGDYCDRGPDTRRVIDLLLDLEQRPGLSTVFLRGNHEDMWLAYLGRDGHWGESWMANGGDHAVASYGLKAHCAPADLLAAMPPAHLDFIDRLRLYYDTPTHLLVHAGIDPRRPFADQDTEDLLWIRDPFLKSPHGLGRTIVFGHSAQRELRVDLPYKIGIDTGCVYGGALTCLSTADHHVWQVAHGSRTVRDRPLPAGRGRS